MCSLSKPDEPWVGRNASLVACLLSAKPHAILINFMTARRLRAYPLPATRRAAPSASSSETRMHAACMVPTTLLSHFIGSYPQRERYELYARRMNVRCQLPTPSLPRSLHYFLLPHLPLLRFLTFPSAQAPPTLSATTVHTGLHSTTTDCNSTTSPSEY